MSSASEVLAEACRQIEEENFRIAVEAAKKDLLSRKTLAQRIAAVLPFTITITRKTK